MWKIKHRFCMGLNSFVNYPNVKNSFLIAALFACADSNSNCIHRFSGKNYLLLRSQKQTALTLTSKSPQAAEWRKQRGRETSRWDSITLKCEISPLLWLSQAAFTTQIRSMSRKVLLSEPVCFCCSKQLRMRLRSFVGGHQLLGPKRSGNLMSGFLWPSVGLLRGQIDGEGAREQACQCSKIGLGNKSSLCFYCTIFALSGPV